MKNLNQPTKRSGVGTATVFAAAALLLRLIRCTRLCGLFYILNLCAAACAVTFAVGRRVTEGVHCAAFGNRLLADGANLIARIALGGASGGFGVLRGCLMRCKRLLRVATDVLFAVGAIDPCGVALDRAGGCCHSNGLGVDVVGRVDRNGFGFGGFANRAGVSFCACCRAGGGFCHSAAVPSVVRFFNMTAVTGAHALMLRVIQLCPCAIAVTEGGDGFGVRCAAGAGEGFYAGCNTGCRSGNRGSITVCVFFFPMSIYCHIPLYSYHCCWSNFNAAPTLRSKPALK